jgi:site-specific DNA-methyltransferase (adenine-specific)
MLSKNDGKIFEYNDIKPETWIPEVYRVLKEGSQCYIMTNTLNMEKCLNICRETGFGLHNILVWLKNNTVINRWYMKNCEYVLFLRKGRAKAINNKGSQTVHQFDNIIGDKIHPTEKPVDLMKYYIANSSNEGDTVLDMFMGVGSSGVAAKELHRKFIGIEIDKKYYDIAEKRLEE